MSNRRRAQFGLVSALGILVVTIGVLFAGARAGLERQGRTPAAASTTAFQPHVGDVSVVIVQQK